MIFTDMITPPTIKIDQITPTNNNNKDDSINSFSISPSNNIPKANIVEDDQEELNLDRYHLANLRKERISGWVNFGAASNANSDPDMDENSNSNQNNLSAK